MAQYTPNFNLYEPDSSDDFADFRTEFNNNMNIIDQNLGGGGGSGGHTIIDEDGNALAQESGLQFTGSVSVSDDAVNDKTVVDIKGGNVYGAFVDTDRILASGTFAGSFSYTATEDSCAVVGIVSDSSSEAKIYIDGVVYTSLYNTGGSSVYQNATVYIRKGQVMTVSEGNGAWTVSYSVYGLTQGTNGIFAPVIYSDNERVIGVWRDNKPLYQKTLVVNNLNLDISGTPIDITSLGVEMCTPIYGGSYYIVSGVKRGFAKLEYQQPNEVYLYPAVNRSNTTCYVTIQYTKTADVAGSGNWNTDGVPTVHYDTNEQVVGTYLGKPLYQITYSGLSLVCTNANQSYATNVNWGNIKKIVHSDIIDQYGQSCAGSVVYTGTPAKIAVYMQMANRTVTDITIQYTKTTD